MSPIMANSKDDNDLKDKYVVGLFGVYRPSEFFTHMETSPLPVKGCKFGPMLGTHGHWAVKVLYRATPTAARAYGL